MIKSALTCVDIKLVKLNSMKHSTEDNNNNNNNNNSCNKHFAKNTSSQSHPMTKSKVKVNVFKPNPTLQPQFRSLETDVEKSKSPEHLTIVRKMKRSYRNRKKKPIVVQNSTLVRELTDSDGLISEDLLSLVSTISLRNERSSESVGASITGIGKTTNKVKVDSGNSCASFPRSPFVRPRKKLLILDINGLLADIVSPPPKEHKADTKISRRAVFRRPACREFLKFCFERFEVGVWSSRSEKIASRVLDYLMGEMKHKLLFCWDISRCTATEFRTLENRHKTLVFKELRRIWEKHDRDLPWNKGEYNESNTLLLDDSPYKALLNPAHTAVFPHPYKFGDIGSDSSLGAGGDLRVYLEELSAAKDVQKFVEKNPFGQRPITESSSSWDFYLKVISTMYSLPTSI